MTTRDDILLALLAADPGAALRAFDQHELHTRMARAQATFRNLKKDNRVPVKDKNGTLKYSFVFAPLEDYLNMARAGYAAEGLNFTQHVDGSVPTRDPLITVTSSVSFGTATVSSSMSVVSQGSDQDHGGTITYLRRYTLSALMATTGTDEDDDANHPKTGPTVESKDAAEHERADKLRSAAKGKAEAARVEPQEQARPWPALSFRPEDPNSVADARYVGAVVMELLGADYFGNPQRGEGLYQMAYDVGEAMLSKAPTRPQGPDQVIDYCNKMRASIKANPKRLDEIKDRVVPALVPF